MLHTYITRRWILQEVSANEATFLLLRGRLLLLRALDYASTCPLNTTFQDKLQLDQYDPLRNALNMFLGTGLPLHVISSIRPWEAWYRPEPYMYLYLLMRSGPTQVSRHEDVFYALRALATRDLSLPEPVYGGTKVEVHKKHAAAFIRMGCAAAILQNAGMAWRQDPGMPSWCPNFGLETARTTLNCSITQVTLLMSGGSCPSCAYSFTIYIEALPFSGIKLGRAYRSSVLRMLSETPL